MFDEAIDVLYGGNWWALRTWPGKYLRKEIGAYTGLGSGAYGLGKKGNLSRIRKVWTGNLSNEDWGMTRVPTSSADIAAGLSILCNGTLTKATDNYLRSLGIHWYKLTAWVAWGKETVPERRRRPLIDDDIDAMDDDSVNEEDGALKQEQDSRPDTGRQLHAVWRKEVEGDSGDSNVQAMLCMFDEGKLRQVGLRQEWYERLNGDNERLWWVGKRLDFDIEGYERDGDVDMADA